MSTQKFEKIVREFSEMAGLGDWHELAENGFLAVDDVLMRIEPSEQAEQACVILSVNFSSLPTLHSEDFLRLLLNLNFLAGLSTERVFGVNPDTSEIIGMRRILMTDDLDAQALYDLLQEEARAARAWEKNWPLEKNKSQSLGFDGALKV